MAGIVLATFSAARHGLNKSILAVDFSDFSNDPRRRLRVISVFSRALVTCQLGKPSENDGLMGFNGI